MAKAKTVVADSSAKRRLLNKVVMSDDCWNFSGSRNAQGYGSLRFNKKWEKAHRVSYIVHCGQIPQGMYILHSCDNPSCVNPAHLRPGTHKENMRDAVERGRLIGIKRPKKKGYKHANPRKRHEFCIRGHNLKDVSNQYIHEQKCGYLSIHCRECRRLRDIVQRKKRKELKNEQKENRPQI